MGLETQIQTRLEDDYLALTALVGGRIFRYQRARGSDLPAVTFLRFSTEIANHSTGATVTQASTFQVDSWADDMDTVRTVADAVTTALSGWSNLGGTPAIKMCHQMSDQDLSVEPEHGDDVMLYRVSQDYRLEHN